MTHEIQPDEVIRLWPDGPPSTLEGVGPEIEFRGLYAAADSAMLRNVSEPTLSVFRPTNGQSNGVGVIVCPGGGRRLLAWEHEGTDIVRWLMAHGHTAFLLKYRVHGTPATAEEYQAWEVELGSRIDVTGRGRRAIRAMAEGDQRAPEYAALNPNLKMPMLEDDGFVLWESNAILFYLANKRPQSGLWPGEARAQADVSRWLAWRSAHWDAESCGMVAFQKASESVLGLGPADPAFTHAENRISRASLPYLMNRFGNACGLLAILSP